MCTLVKYEWTNVKSMRGTYTTSRRSTEWSYYIQMFAFSYVICLSLPLSHTSIWCFIESVLRHINMFTLSFLSLSLALSPLIHGIMHAIVIVYEWIWSPYPRLSFSLSLFQFYFIKYTILIVRLIILALTSPIPVSLSLSLSLAVCFFLSLTQAFDVSLNLCLEAYKYAYSLFSLSLSLSKFTHLKKKNLIIHI